MRLAGAAEVLSAAAQAAETRPELKPRPDQWVYQKSIESGIGAEHGTRPVTGESWRRYDGTREAVFLNGRLDVGRQRGRTQNRLASLPPDQAALRTAIYKMADAEPRGDRVTLERDGRAFSIATQLLWSEPVGVAPKTRAALYRVVAGIPGVRVHRSVKDGAGRPAIAVTRGYGEEFLLAPATYEMTGRRTVFNGHNAPISKTEGTDSRDRVPPGTVMYSLTLLTVKIVDRAGQR